MAVLADFFLMMMLFFAIFIAGAIVIGAIGAILFHIPCVRRWLDI